MEDISPITYIKTYDSTRNTVVLLAKTRKPNATPTHDCKNAPTLYKYLTPIFAPNLPQRGANRNAARFAIPKTHPY